MTRTSFAPLSVCLLVAAASLGLAQDTGVSGANADNLRYLSARAADRAYRTEIADQMGAEVKGAGEVRRVQFDYAKDGQSFRVRGVLVSFDGVLIERYTLASLGEAVAFSDHDRADSEARHLLEVRGKDALVISGANTRSQTRALALREAAWTGATAARSTDVLELKSGEDDSVIQISQAGLDASPETKAKIDDLRPYADLLGGMPGTQRETLPGGFRLVFDDGVISLADAPAGGLILARHSDEANEARLARFLGRALPQAAPTTVATTGIAGAISAAALPASLSLSDSGQTFAAKVGDTFRVRVRGNASTGYRWEPVSLSAKLQLVSQSSGSAGGPVGGGGSVEFEFRVKSAGTIQLKLNYARAWDKDNPAETLEVTIHASK